MEKAHKLTLPFSIRSFLSFSSEIKSIQIISYGKKALTFSKYV